MSRNSEKPLIQTESLKHQNCETMPSNKKSGSSYHSALQICVVFTFVFVIFLTAKYSSVAIFDVKPEMIRHLAYHDSEVQVDKSRHTFHSRKPFDYIIENQRVRISSEMDQFPFENNQELMDLIPDQGGQPIRAMIATTWRSGSTFLGDILLSHPATFYHYEPLINYKIHQVRDGTPLAPKAIKALENLFKCDYSDLGSYLTYAQAHAETLSHNERLWSHCYGSSRKHCYNPEFLSQFCSLFPFQSLKTVRLRLNLTRQIIEDTNLNVQVLYLVRDPRGTLQSRKHRVWCPGEPDCDQPENLCSDLVKDYYAAQELMKQHPKRIRVIRYEDFCLDIKTNAASLLEFFSFKMHMRVAKFINSHTHENIGGVSSTFRDSKNAPYHWRNELSFAEVQDIQEKCSEALNLWGYKKADTSDELENLQPLLEYHL